MAAITTFTMTPCCLSISPCKPFWSMRHDFHH
jgi:hypothetical protein